MYIGHQKATVLIIKGHNFFEVKNPRQLKTTDGQKSSTVTDIVDGCLFERPEPGCRRNFSTVSELEINLMSENMRTFCYRKTLINDTMRRNFGGKI
jgi:hypothetical protein